MPGLMQQRNIILKTFDHTYYFSYSSGERNRKYMKRREVLTEPEKTSNMSMGFDMDTLQNLRLTGQTKKEKNDGVKVMSFKESLYAFWKCLQNPISINNKVNVPALEFKQPRRLDNLFNPDMNNVTAIDYQSYDAQDENDGVLARWSTEFPRLANNYQSKADTMEAPWGKKSAPVRFNSKQESPFVTMHSC